MSLINANLQKRIDQKKKRLDALRPFPSLNLKRLQEKIALDWTYHSNSIEGSSLSLRETQAILEAGITIRGKPLREHLEVINHAEAIHFVENLVSKKRKINKFVSRKLEITLIEVLEIHRLILAKINDQEAGKLRKVEVFIRGSRYLPPHPRKVPQLTNNFDRWLKKKKNIHPVEEAALAHFKLVKIHPFVDGNGRTARLLMNLILMQKGFPPIVILTQERFKYFDLLELGEIKDKIKPFINFIAERAERALDLYLFTLDTAKEYLSLPELAKHTPYSADYLGLLARRRRLGAIKIEGKWYATRKALENYLRSIGK